VNGGITGSKHLEVHCAYGPSFNTRGDFATPFGYITNTSLAQLFFTDANGDGRSDLCFMMGINGGKTGSGHLDVHCTYGGSFNTRGDFATPFGYVASTAKNPLFFSDTNGDGKADACLIAGVNGGITGSKHLEVHCAYGPSFNTRGDFATPFGYITNTSLAWVAP
jgi:hypothetical protein